MLAEATKSAVVDDIAARWALLTIRGKMMVFLIIVFKQWFRFCQALLWVSGVPRPLPENGGKH